MTEVQIQEEKWFEITKSELAGSNLSIIDNYTVQQLKSHASWLISIECDHSQERMQLKRYACKWYLLDSVLTLCKRLSCTVMLNAI